MGHLALHGCWWTFAPFCFFREPAGRPLQIPRKAQRPGSSFHMGPWGVHHTSFWVFKFFYSWEHQLLGDPSRGSLFQCLPSRKLAAVIKIKQTRKCLALPSGIFIKMKICNCFRPKWHPKIQHRRERGLILAILVHPHWNRIKIWRMFFYLCMIYLQKQLNVLAEQHPSTELKQPTAVYLPPGIAGQAVDLCRRIKSVKQVKEILSLGPLVSWHYPQLFLLTENKFR